MNSKIQLLINTAKNKMAESKDLIHDLGHAQRVVNFAEQISAEFSLSEKQRQALFLAAWWHDVGRVQRKKPSYVWINFIDDMISAFFLWIEMIKIGLHGQTAGLSTRAIICKSLGTGAILTKILLQKKDRFLVDILKDADYLDLLSLERSQLAYSLIENSRRYNWAYRFLNWWLFAVKKLKFKTQTAKQILKDLLRDFFAWIKSSEIFNWHVHYFGYKWSLKALKRVEKKVYQIQCLA